MSQTLTLNKPFVFVGLDTFTYTIPAAGLYNVNFLATVYYQATEGFGAGSAADQGLGVTGGTKGDGSNAQNPLVAGNTGQGFLGTATDGASGNGSGYGAGAGGGFAGFVGGSYGPGYGGVGQGFGYADGYAHSLPYVTTPTSIPSVLSNLAVIVQKNGSTVYTAPAPAGHQRMVEFKTVISCAQGDVITIVPSNDSSAKINVSINQGI